MGSAAVRRRGPRTTFALSFLVFVSAILGAQNLAPLRTLRTIRTERFDIIFPEESRATARTLAGFADAAYDRVSSALGIEVPSRIPVLVTPDTDVLNGYMNPIPYPHIVIYDTLLDTEWTTFPDALYGLFFHELVHAVSLSARGDGAEFLYRMFGGWVLPAYLNAPLYMVEGVTVSFESLDGAGRANDPLVAQRLRQAKTEGRFLDPFQAAGVWDLPPRGRAYYEYGGMFSAYIQKRWGMETYAELWRRMGSPGPVSFSYYKSGFAGIFRRVVGVDLREAWNDFEEEFRVEGLDDAGSPLPGATLAGPRYAAVGPMASDGERLFWYDETGWRVVVYEDGKATSFLGAQGAVEGLDLSRDGTKLLVSSFRYAGSRGTALAVEYDVASGRPTGRTWNGVFKARYFRDGIVALRSTGHVGRLVLIGAGGEETVVAEGGDKLLLSAPAVVDDNRIAYFASVGGARRLRVYDAQREATAELRTDRPDDDALWASSRGLSAVDGRLYFSYSTDGGFYRLAVLEGDRLVISDRDMSGGVFSPLPLGGRIVYRGEFAQRDALLVFPDDPDSIRGSSAPVVAVPVDGPTDVVVSGSAREAAFGTDRTGPPPSEPASGPASAEGRKEVPAAGAASFEETAYSGLRYFNPLGFWIPFPLLRSDGGGLSVDGAGALSYLSDPTDSNTLYLAGGWDWHYGAPFAELDWAFYCLGVPAEIAASDTVELASYSGYSVAYRALRASAAAIWTVPLRRSSATLSVGPGLAVVASAVDTGAGTAYQWPLSTPRFGAELSLSLSDERRLPWEQFGRGVSLALHGAYLPSDGIGRADAVVRLAAEDARLRLVAYGAVDGGTMESDGTSPSFGTPSWAGSAVPFSASAGPLPFLAGGSAELKLFTLEIQGNLSQLYFNRLFANLAYRGVAFQEGGGVWADAVVATVGLKLTVAPIAAAPIAAVPRFWGALSLPALKRGAYRDAWMLGLSLSFGD